MLPGTTPLCLYKPLLVPAGVEVAVRGPGVAGAANEQPPDDNENDAISAVSSDRK